MGAIYIAIIMLCRVAQHLCTKKTSNQMTGMLCFFKYSAYRQLLSAAFGFGLILIAHSGFQCDSATIVISVFSGLMLVLASGLSLAILKTSTVALASLFSTAGILVPCIAGIFLFHTPMSIGQWVGVLLFFVAAYFLISSSAKIYCKPSAKAFLMLLGLMLAEGFTMLAQQMFTHYVPDGDVSVFSFLSFGIVGVFMLIAALLNRNRSDEKEAASSKLTPDLLGLGAVLSAAVFIINQLATLATAIVPPAVLFTFINGGSTIIGAIVAALFFHEKLTPRSIAGILLGVAALVIIKIM